MTLLYPLKFKPIFKEKIWGGQKIKTILGKDFSPLKNCGELWALSGVEGDESVVCNGFLAGNNLSEVIEVYMDELMGDAVFQKYGNTFPVLVKFLNSSDYLSVQVHPDDVLAMKRHRCMGKTEMWYIIDSDTDSELIIGFKNGVGKEAYLEAMKDNSLKDILNHVKIAAGDVIYLPAGRVHAIGKGILLAEIQQTSDITYRIYDWDRTDDNGNPRELHTAEALDVIDFKYEEDYYTSYARLKNMPAEVLKSEYFNVNNLTLDKEMSFDLASRDSFTAYVCVEGAALIIFNNTKTLLSKGETLLMPAEINDFQILPENMVGLLEVYM
ncbi:MAG: putative mannose-6-phosphate isomerase YvyI [Bacteroidetes bacterium ADurb.Bin408]|nr:MAG: putative mannose-6-phosphate isomerase YvyI [Bacteroidetes bacterium ADurb.Bin408]